MTGNSPYNIIWLTKLRLVTGSDLEILQLCSKITSLEMFYKVKAIYLGFTNCKINE